MSLLTVLDAAQGGPLRAPHWSSSVCLTWKLPFNDEFYKAGGIVVVIRVVFLTVRANIREIYVFNVLLLFSKWR